MFRKTKVLALCSGFLFCFFMIASATQFLTVAGTVGTSEFRIGSGAWTVLNIDDQVPDNAMVRVLSRDDSVQFTLPDGTSFTVPGGTVAIRASDIIRYGKSGASLNAKNAMQTETKSEVAAVRGSIQSSTVYAAVTFLKGSAQQQKPGQTSWDKIRNKSLIPVLSEVKVLGTNDGLELSLPDSSKLKTSGISSLKLENLSAVETNHTLISSIILYSGKILFTAAPSTNQVLYLKTGQNAANSNSISFNLMIKPLQNATNSVILEFSYDPSIGGFIGVSRGSAMVMSADTNATNIMIGGGFKVNLSASALPSEVQIFDTNSAF